ncbi:MAG: hypothetical protein WAU24_02460 [Chitinophagaceae bacterium]
MMIRIKKILFILFSVCIVSTALAQDSYATLSMKVLLKNKKDKQYAWENDSNSTYITYLGKINTDTGKQYKIIIIKNVWGPNKHTYGSIWVYDTSNSYIGRFVLGDAYDLPIKIKKNKLIFSNKGKGCAKLIYAKIDFHQGIPKNIFIPACEGMGDIYQFSKD